MDCSSSTMGLDYEESPHVLAVDDSLVDRKLIESLLKNSCIVTTAENGQRALELLGLGDRQHIINKKKKKKKDSKVNLIITDYCMPGMTGYELLKKLKVTSNALRALMIFTKFVKKCDILNLFFWGGQQESSDLKEIPVVIVSSENVPTRIKKCMKEGAQEFMLKPLQQSDIKKLRCHMTKFSKPTNGKLCMGS
ncbi:unnamed protein product [Camellia sinensis]